MKPNNSAARSFCFLASSLLIAAVCCGQSIAHATVGATTPFISFEAEGGVLAGGAQVQSLVSAPTNPYSSPQLEASGHAYVQLTATGQSVTWTNTTGQNITAFNVRACIPDAPTGGGITSTVALYVNGAFRQAFSVNSLQNYCYEGTNYNGQTDKNPADGNPRGFWNDTHAFIIGAALAPGDTITLRKDVSNSADFYYIDVVDLEAPPLPLAQPANSLSILSYGAISNNPGIDNTAAINNCFKAAQAQGKIAWIPPGTFCFSAINGGLKASGITIAGAGPWYSTLYRVTPMNNNQGVANIITTTSTKMQDLALDCNASSRAGNNNNGAVNFSGNNWLVNNVWIQHATSAFWCAGYGGTAQNCRVLSVWSDGGNFNNVESANGIGINLTYSNNFVRGTGDDAMAINSVNYNVFGNATYYYTTMSNITYVNNTAVGAWGGKNMGIYGGINDVVTNNLLCDTARYIGLGVGKFGVNGSDLISATVLGNTVLRCGGNGYSQQQQAMMIGNGGDGQSSGMVAGAYCADNTIIDSLYAGVGFSSSTNIVFQYNTIINPGQDGIVVGGGSLGSGVTGSAIIQSNTVTGLNSGRIALTNNVSGYAAIIPTAAAGYPSGSGVTLEPCSEGGQEITSIENGDWSAYTNINLAGVSSFVARAASAGTGGNIEIRLDSPSGTLAGTCVVPGTGGWQNYVNAYANISGVSGTHSIYLVYTGATGSLLNLEWFGFFTAPPLPSHQLGIGNVYALKALVSGKYVSAPNNGSNALVAQSSTIDTAEKFQIADAGGGNVGLLSLINTQFVCAENNGASPLIANRSAIGSWETFTEFDAGSGTIALRTMNNGLYVTAENGGTNALLANASTIGLWQSFAPVFVSGVAPAAPNNLTAAAGNARVALNWRASPGATGYNVKYSRTNGGAYAILAANWQEGTSFIHNGLSNGVTYYYVVAATNLAGQSSQSLQANATPGTLSRTLWVASSSTSGNDTPDNAVDGDLSTRWSTGTSQANGQWFQVDLGSAATFNQVGLNSVNSGNDYPRGYQVNVSADGVTWGSPIATGTGTFGATTIPFAPQAARFVRVTQTGSANGTFWSIHEFNLMATLPTAPANLVAELLSSQSAKLSWNASAGADAYEVKRATQGGGSDATVAMNVTGLNFIDTGLIPGTTYYYVVTATNAYGESAPSVEVSVHPVATSSPQLTLVTSGGEMRLGWPTDHLGWHLEMQTNSPGSGLGTNWLTVPNSSVTNEVWMPVNVGNGATFYRLAYP